MYEYQYKTYFKVETIIMQNAGPMGVIMIGVVVYLIYLLVRPSKAKKEERANLKRIADALEEQAKDKKE